MDRNGAGIVLLGAQSGRLGLVVQRMEIFWREEEESFVCFGRTKCLANLELPLF